MCVCVCNHFLMGWIYSHAHTHTHTLSLSLSLPPPLSPDTIDKWDEDKLKEVVQKKHGGKVKQKTDIVSPLQFIYLSLNFIEATHTAVEHNNHTSLCIPPPPLQFSRLCLLCSHFYMYYFKFVLRYSWCSAGFFVS